MKNKRFADRQFEHTDDGLAMKLEPEDGTTIGALRLLLEGVEMLREVGYIDHIDAGDMEDGAAWEAALKNARRIVKASEDARNQ